MKASDFLAIAPMFASEDGTRKALETSFRHGNHLFVTDGRIALVGDASGLDADEIFETRDLEQRRIGDKIIKEHIEAREKDVYCGKYRGYGLCNIGEAVCAAFANLEPDMMLLRANKPLPDDPDDDGKPDSVRKVHNAFVSIILANPARTVIAGDYASLIFGLVRHYGPVEAFADPNSPHAELYFRGDNWRCVLMPVRIVSSPFMSVADKFYEQAISDAATGELVHKRSDGEVNIDALRSPSTHPTPTKGGEQ